MATIFVNSGAAGANNGTSWADAYTSIASTTGAAAGDEIRVHETHTQTGTIGSLTWSNGTNANPVTIVCVDKDAADALSVGAEIVCNSGNMSLVGSVVGDGMTWRNTAGTVTLNFSTETVQRHRNSTVVQESSSNIAVSSADRSYTLLEDCTLDFSSAGGNGVVLSVPATGGVLVMRGGTIKARSAGHLTLISATGSGSVARLAGVDVQNAITNVCTINGAVRLSCCKLPTFTNLVSATPTKPEASNWALLESCRAGTLAAPELGLTWLESRVGTVKSSLFRYRTGGADDPSGDQANPHSWEMASNANALDQVSWLESPPLTRWVDAGAGQTVTVYLAGAADLDNDETWLEVLSPSEAGTPTAQGRYQSTRCAFRATPAALDRSTGTVWEGADTGTDGGTGQQKIDVSISPTVAGPVEVRVCLAKASTTLYLDPALYLS